MHPRGVAVGVLLCFALLCFALQLNGIVAVGNLLVDLLREAKRSAGIPEDTVLESLVCA